MWLKARRMVGAIQNSLTSEACSQDKGVARLFEMCEAKQFLSL